MFTLTNFLLFSLLSSVSHAAELLVDPWTITTYPDRPATVGDTVTFVWNGGFHDVHMHPSGDCTEGGRVEVVAQGGSGEGSYTFDTAGMITFACDVGSHCEAGQIIKFNVAEAVVAPPPTPTPPTEAPPTEAPPTEAPPTEAPPTEAPPTEAPPTEAPPTTTVVDIVVDSEVHTQLEALVIQEELVDTLSSEGPFTLFAPTDAAFDILVESLGGSIPDTLDITSVLFYHVVSEAKLLSTDLGTGLGATAQGEDICITVSDDGVMVNQAMVTTADIETDNGVVHVIDAVLLPPSVSGQALTCGDTTEAPPTEAPPTEAPPTEVPPTEAPPTEAPPTEAPPTEAPPTEAPPTEAPPTEAPPTEAPPTEAPPTEPAPTEAPPTEAPPTEAEDGSSGPTAHWLMASFGSILVALVVS